MATANTDDQVFMGDDRDPAKIWNAQVTDALLYVINSAYRDTAVWKLRPDLTVDMVKL